MLSELELVIAESELVIMMHLSRAGRERYRSCQMRCSQYWGKYRTSFYFRHVYPSILQGIPPMFLVDCVTDQGTGVLKVWEMATLSAFLFSREVSRQMVTRGEGTIILTGATASLRGAAGHSAFSSAMASTHLTMAGYNSTKSQKLKRRIYSHVPELS